MFWRMQGLPLSRSHSQVSHWLLLLYGLLYSKPLFCSIVSLFHHGPHRSPNKRSSLRWFSSATTETPYLRIQVGVARFFINRWPRSYISKFGIAGTCGLILS